MTIEIKLNNNRTFECDNTIIGKTYENKTTTLKFYLTEEMISKDFYIEFEKPDGTKFITERLIITSTYTSDGTTDEFNEANVEYEIPNSLLDLKGELKVEAVMRKDDEVWKSYTLKFNILNSINASEDIPEQYPDFISETQKVIDLVEITGDGTKYLSNDGTYKEVTGGSSVEVDVISDETIEEIVDCQIVNASEVSY